MNDVIAPKRSSLKPKLVTTMMFLKLNMSLIPSNPVEVAESSDLEHLDSISSWIAKWHWQSEYNEIEDDHDHDEEEEEEDLSPMQVESEEADYIYVLSLSLSISLCNNMKIQSQLRAKKLKIYRLVLFEWISLWFEMNMHVTQIFN